MLFLLWADQL